MKGPPVATLIKRLLALVIAASVLGVIYMAVTRESAQKLAGFGGGKRGGQTGQEFPVPVVAGTAKASDMPVFLDGVGTARALNTVTVRPQVDGKLMRIAFKEGQTVRKGEVLAEIDPTTYKATLDQAVAKRQLTQTQLANARKDLERYQRIQGVIAQKTVDTQAAQVAQLEAQVKADEAAIASAQAVLDYTRILAPIDGRTGIRLVDEGNIIRASGDAGIVTITQVQPISVLFTLPQQQLPQVSRAMAKGAVPAEAMDADNKSVLDAGVLQVVDNQVDQTTGTVRMKADFPNASLQLWPGQFVNVRLRIDTLRQVVVVPTPAIQRGPQGPFVYVINAEERAGVRPVTLAMQNDTESVVRSGLEAGERVITSGFSRLQDGSRVLIGRVGGDAPPIPRGPGAGRNQPAGQGPGAEAPTGAAPGAGASAAGGGGRGRFERIREACAADIAAHCALPREQVRACMEQHKARFSAPCQAALAGAGENPGEAGKAAGKGDARPKRDRADGAPGTGAVVREGLPKSSPQ
jgi:multidrug efflux system membrane fusion protein